MLLETLVEKILFTFQTYIWIKNTRCLVLNSLNTHPFPQQKFKKNKPKQINSNPFISPYLPTQHNKQQIVGRLPLDNQLHDVLGGHGRSIVLRVVPLGSLEANPGEYSSHFLHVIL